MIRAKREANHFGLKRLRGWVHLSEGHLSRVEHGQCQLSWDKAQILAQQLGLDPVELVAVTSRLPATVMRDLAVPGLAAALVSGDFLLPLSTRLQLRRLSISAEVERQFPPTRDLPDPSAALSNVGMRYQLVGEWTPITVELNPGLVRCAAGSDKDVRFELAHALGHVQLGSGGCNPAAFGVSAETDATAYACHFLVPNRLLEAELNRAPRLDLTQGEGVGSLVEFVAVALKIPIWLAARRLVEESHLGRLIGVAE